MTLLEKIQSAQSKKELDTLVLEIILSKDHQELTKVFKEKMKELDKSDN